MARLREELSLFSIVNRYKKRAKCWVANVNEKWREQPTLKMLAETIETPTYKKALTNLQYSFPRDRNAKKKTSTI